MNRKGREAILQAFPPGTPAMADDRRVRVDPKDADTVFENFQKAKKVRPLNYGHGKDPAKGGKAAGKLVECIRTPDGGIDFRAADLTPTAVQEIEDGEWLGTSARFTAWKDNDGYIHPVDVEHLSLTNDPAILDQKEIYLLETVHETDYVDVPGVLEPEKALAALRKLLGLSVAATLSEITEEISRLFPATSSPKKASVEKEPEMEKLTPQAPGAAGAGGEPPKQAASLSREEVLAFVKEMITEDRKVFREEFIREQRQKTAVENAINSGKVTVGCREAAEKLAASNIEAFEAFVASAPAVVSVTKQIEDSPEGSITTTDFSRADLNDERVRARLHKAALEMVAAKQATDYGTAIESLTAKKGVN